MNIDDAIRAAYAGGRNFGTDKQGRKPLYQVAADLGMSREAFYKRAGVLGLRRPQSKSPAWTPEEDAIVEQFAHRSLPVIQRQLKAHGFHRTQTAISIRRLKTKGAAADLRLDANSMSATQLATILGVNQRTVGYWIRQGMLVATKEHLGENVFLWLITPTAIRNFIIDYLAHVPINDHNKYWIVDILVPNRGAKAAGREAA